MWVLIGGICRGDWECDVKLWERRSTLIDFLIFFLLDVRGPKREMRILEVNNWLQR